VARVEARVAVAMVVVMVAVTVGMAAASGLAALKVLSADAPLWRAPRRERKRSHSTPPSRDDDAAVA
jgi:hypothetical protein